MAFTVTTFQDTYMGGEPSNTRIAMFEIIRGVHEREDAVGLSRTAFLIADGTTSTDVSMSDLEGMAVGGPEDYTYTNLRLAITLIRGIIGSPSSFSFPIGGVTRMFATDSTYETFYTTDEPLGGPFVNFQDATGIDIGVKSNNSDPGQGGFNPTIWSTASEGSRFVNDARYWQAVQDALNELKYVRHNILPVEESRTGSQSGSYPTYEYRSADEAWSARGTIPTPPSSFFVFGGAGTLGWTGSSGLTNLPPPNIDFRVYACGVARQAELSFGLENMAGSIDFSEVLYSGHARAGTIVTPAPPVPLTFSLNGQFVTIGGHVPAASITLDGIELSQPFVLNCSIDTTEPSTWPWAAAFGGTYILIQRLILHVDITGELTDQE